MNRQTFIASVAVGTVAPNHASAAPVASLFGAASDRVDPTASQSPAERAQLRAASDTVPFHFDRAAFQSVIERPYRHRQFVAPMSYAAATVGMSHFVNSLAAYADPSGFAAGPKSLHCVAVLYAGYSYSMVLDDAMYAKYPIGLLDDEEMRPTDLSFRDYWKSIRRNPMADFLRPLTDQGVSFFVCNNALTSLAVDIARRISSKNTTVTREQVVTIHDELADHFLPSTMLVPAGVAAVNAVQEARFTFLP
jgi:intracellular sulfur oxidation DsrE/DsrF family protein